MSKTTQLIDDLEERTFSKHEIISLLYARFRRPASGAGRRASLLALGMLAIGMPVIGFGLPLLGISLGARAEISDFLSAERLSELFKTNLSLVHVGGRDTFNVTTQGRAAGTTLYAALERHDLNLAKVASDIWDEIIPIENYGGEYTTLQWFAHYYMATEAERAKMVADPYTRVFYEYFAKDDYATLKEFLKRKYHAADIGDEQTSEGQQRKVFLEDLVNFANPRREEWEKTSSFIKVIDPKPGDSIADVGAGPGYYSFKLAAQVGRSGRVFAIDTEVPHIKYVEAVKATLGVENIQTVLSDGRTIGQLETKVDKVVLCSLYHNVYAMTNAGDRESFVNAIKGVLKDGGHIYLIDNAAVRPGSLPYHGPYVAKEMVAAQLVSSGFKLVAYHQPIIQRYALVFRYDAPKQ